MIEVKIIDSAHKADVNIPNQPFGLFGRMIPGYMDGRWSYSTELSDTTGEMCFPDENYDYDEMKKDCVFIGAYEGGQCIGLAIMKQGFFKYMYLYDLKVNREYRSKATAASTRWVRTTMQGRVCSTSKTASASAGLTPKYITAPVRKARRISFFIWIAEFF